LNSELFGMLNQYNEKCQRELLSLDKSIQIKRKSDDSIFIEERDEESINKKSKINESDKKIVTMYAKYSK
jgi:hypothetical protein